jgi:hypothetical protein
MTKIREISVIVTVWIVTIFVTLLILLVLRVEVLVPKVSKALDNIQAMETNTTRTEAELAGLLDITRHIALDEKKAQQQQLADIHTLTIKGGKLLDDADDSVKKLGDAADSLNTLSPAVVAAIQDNSVQLQDTLGMGQNMLKAATLDLLDPNIQKSMDNIQSATNYAANSTANLDATTHDIREYVHRETTPIRGTWNFIKELINQTWAIRGAFGF